MSDQERLKVANTLFFNYDKAHWRHQEVEEDFSDFTEEQVQKPGNRIKPKRAAGPDGIRPEAIKAIAKHRAGVIAEVMSGRMRNEVSQPVKRGGEVDDGSDVLRPAELDSRTDPVERLL